MDCGECPNEDIDKKKSDINVGKALKEETKPKGLTFWVLLFTQKKTERNEIITLWFLNFLACLCVCGLCLKMCLLFKDSYF